MGSIRQILATSRFVEPRVGQLDASILDSELLDLLKSQLWSSFKWYHPEIKDRYESELLMLLKLLLFKVTIWDHSATYGSKLQNLKLVDARSSIGGRIIPMSKTQKLGYGIIVVGGGYFWNKLEDYLARTSTYDYQEDDENNYHYDSGSGNYQHIPNRRRQLNLLVARKLRVIADGLSSLWAFSSLANFVLFLYSGRYSTLILRLLKIRYIPASRTLTRQVNFEFQNRQLVWNAFTEFLLFTLPLISIQKVKRRSLKVLKSLSSSRNGPNEPQQLQGEMQFLPQKTCPICYKSTSVDSSANAVSTEVTNPYQGECGHIYCYVCLKTKLAEDPEEGWLCLRCNKTIKTAVPYRDIDESAIVRQNSQPAGAIDSNKEKQTTSVAQDSNEHADINEDDDRSIGSDEAAEYEMDDDDDIDDNTGELSGSNFIVDDGDF